MRGAPRRGRRFPGRSSSPTPRDRRGIVLVIVLIVVVVLSLAAYTFSDLMVAEKVAVQMHGQQVQAQALVDSGIESVKQFLLLDPLTQADYGGLLNNPTQFQGITVAFDDDVSLRGKFTVLAPGLDEFGSLAGVRYGLENESTRLNLNTLPLVEQMQAGTGQALLMALPGMTEDVADAILDWIDEDEEPREAGAELEYYSTLNPPYAPKNGPPETVEELLLVRGVTPQLLFGADVNRNGVIDANEVDMQAQLSAAVGVTGTGASSSSFTTSSGYGASPLDRGWSAYLTLYSQERNLNSQGLPRININQDDLDQLETELSEVFSEEWTSFIVAYRRNGPYSENGQAQPTKFKQVLDLIGAQTRGESSDQQQAQPLESPFSNDPLAMATYLPQLMDGVTVSEGQTIPGRININEAPRTVLAGIPGMTEEILENIITQRQNEPPATDGETLPRQHETWLLQEGVVTLEEMRTLTPFITGGGNVFRAQIIGYFQGGGPAARAEVVIDATQAQPAVVFWRDISHLGRGFPLELLGLELAPTP